MVLWFDASLLLESVQTTDVHKLWIQPMRISWFTRPLLHSSSISGKKRTLFLLLSHVIRIPLIPLQTAFLSLARHVDVFICALLTFFSCAFLTTTAPSLTQTAPSFQKLRPYPAPSLLRPPYTGPEEKIVGEWSENSPILKIGSKLAVWAKFCCMKQNCNLLGNFEGMVTVEWISQ